MSTVAVLFLEKSITYLNFGRTSQIRTGDLYHVNIDGCTNVHSSSRRLAKFVLNRCGYGKFVAMRKARQLFLSIFNGARRVSGNQHGREGETEAFWLSTFENINQNSHCFSTNVFGRLIHSG